MGSEQTGSFGAIRKYPWESLLASLMVLSGVLLLALRADFGFFLDDWALVIGREGSPTDWLLPHNEHIVLLPAAIYKLSLAVFGMTPMPIHILAVALFLTSVGLFFFWLKPLVGEASAVLAAAVMLFLGCAAEDLVWAFQIGFFGSVAAGMAALLLLRRGTTRADAGACLLLTTGLLFSSLALPFLAGAAVQLLLRGSKGPDWRGLFRRSWVILLPALCFAVWWLGWGHLAPSSLSFTNAAEAPLYALSALGYAATVVTGTFPLRGITSSLLWAVPGLIVLGAVGYLLYRRRRVPPEFVVAAAIGLSFWLLSGLNHIPGREFYAGRYQYPGAVFILMILGGAMAGYRPGTRTLKVLAAVAAFAVTVNLIALFKYFNDDLKPYEQRGLAMLTAFDIAEATVDGGFRVGMNKDGTAVIGAREYFEATGRYGSPALTEAEIGELPEEDRIRLDQTLVGALPVTLRPAGELRPVRGQCRTVRAGPAANQTLELDTPLIYIHPQNQVVIRLGRFGPGAEALAWQAGPRPTGYEIPPDLSGVPWRIGFQGTGPVTVCPALPAG